MKIVNENGYLIYSVSESEIIIDNIKVYEQRKGTGKVMINELKGIANELGLSIELYSYPQDDTINQIELNNFYINLGFELDINDVDNRMFIWGN